MCTGLCVGGWVGGVLCLEGPAGVAGWRALAPGVASRARLPKRALARPSSSLAVLNEVLHEAAWDLLAPPPGAPGALSLGGLPRLAA